MQTFKDSAGRSWSIAITIATVKRVRVTCDVDLAADDLGELLTKMGSDPVLLADVIFVLCSDQVERAGLTDEQFGEGLAGDAIDAATDAFLGALIDFTPKKKRAMLRSILNRLDDAQTKAIDSAIRYIESDQFEQEMTSAIDFGETSTPLPELSELTPDP